MYYQNYEDYMRNILGYPIEAQNTYEAYPRDTMLYDDQMCSTIGNYSDEIMDLYPDIYKLVQPMVCKICEANTKPITRELIDQMTEEIYLNLESVPEVDTVVNVRVTTPKTSKEIIKENDIHRQSQLKTNRTNIIKENITKTNSKTEEITSSRENREDRQRIPNRTLQDLIRILILNRLLGLNRPHRPRPPRPPFPGPGNPPPRPPFQREDRYYNGLF